MALAGDDLSGHPCVLRVVARVARVLSAVVVLLFFAGQATADEISVSGEGITATVRFTAPTDVEGEPVELVVSRIDGVSWTFRDLEVATSLDDPSYGVYAERPLQIRDLEGDGVPEVILSLYWGGAHCCSRSVVAAFDGTSGAYRVAISDWGEADPKLMDVDRDGTSEFVGFDGGLAYWGGSFGESGFPIQIWRFTSSGFLDVTRSFSSQVRADMRRWWARAATGELAGLSVRGPLAAYLADAHRLGAREARAAWLRVYRFYQRADRRRFVTALRTKLTNLGYRAAHDPVPPLPPFRRSKWRACRSPVPEVGFIADLRAQGVSCALAQRMAATLSPSGGGFTCRSREVAIEEVLVQCRRGPFERIRFISGV